MPAGEKTKYNQKTLHKVFGCTALLMLISTIWMFADDHYREWKDYQRRNRTIETRLLKWRRDAQRTRDLEARVQELQMQLDNELGSPPSEEAFEEFVQALNEEDAEKYAERLRAIYQSFSDDKSANKEVRQELMELVGKIVKRAKTVETKLSGERKFASAEYDKARADYDIGVRDEVGPEKLAELEQIVKKYREIREELTRRTQAQTAYRLRLQEAQRKMLAAENDLRKQIADAQAEYDRLAKAVQERQVNWGKKILELPILDAFNGPLRPENWWAKNMRRPNGSFGEVKRFDRCVTCHENIEKTAPGSAVKPAYVHQHEVTLKFTTPEEPPATTDDERSPQEREDGEGGQQPSLADIYGFDIADTGLVESGDVTIRNVLGGTIAARAEVVESDYGIENEIDGLQPGDIILFINSDKISVPQDVEQILVRDADWGEEVTIRVHRGLPHPFSTHPRLELFVGSMSPHKYAEFGCSVCHEGQGSATEFKWVSHSPNTPEQGEAWADEYGWFNNHHWIYPMFPKRFAESSCLKCHHDVVELDSNDDWPEAPAPKVVHGFHLIKQYGCFGCHEINGYKGDDRIGPDLRTEPNYYAAAEQIKADPGFRNLPSDVKSYVRTLIVNPEKDEIRHKLVDYLKADEQSDEKTLTATSHKMKDVLDDVDYPGELRKVGPSLRHIGSKVGTQFLYDWIRDPKHFRPSTKMPRFFGQWDHLKSDPEALHEAERFEPVEILSVVHYLINTSQPMEMIESDVLAEDWSDPEMIERGKQAFELRGCLACHQHADFPEARSTQGPNLTGLGDKFSRPDTPPENAKAWLYTWLKSPTNYHARTKMPNLFLDPVEQADGTVVDPAADIAAYLLSSSTGWKPADGMSIVPNTRDVNDLLLQHLKTKMFYRDAETAIAEGKIPDHVVSTLKGAEAELAQGPLTLQSTMRYLGQKTIAKYGCYGCHDIVGFEDAKPIGTALSDWGRKESSKLAFEHILEYLHHGHGHEQNDGHDGDAHDHGVADDGADAEDEHEAEGYLDAEVSEGLEEGHIASSDDGFDESFYIEKIQEHDRAGFIWQKLKEPRSYDFEKASNKDSYNDRLRMPLFPFSPQEREAVITFVLGLVAEPPHSDYIYQPSSRKEALIAGQKALDKYNCTGCHMLKPSTWTVTAEPGAISIPQPDPAEEYPFMRPSYSADELAESAKVDDFYGTVSGHFYGMPTIADATGEFQIFDEEEIPLEPEDLEDPELDPATFIHKVQIWEPSLFDGSPVVVGTTVSLSNSVIEERRPPVGGDLAIMLLPRVTEIEKESNPGASGSQAWGWLPPPLIGQGSKVQTDWMHDFLLEPYPIRPAVFLRMPKFNMSSAEATAIANFFAARDNAAFPYAHSERTNAARLEQLANEYAQRLKGASERPPNGDDRFDHAMNIVTYSAGCVQCHLVGDFEPQASERAKAPNLASVEKRLRPEYVRRWIAKPSQTLPYTPMQVIIKYPDGLPKNLYHGTAVEQLDAVVDLLMNFSRYTESKTKVSDLVKPATSDAASDPSTN